MYQRYKSLHILLHIILSQPGEWKNPSVGLRTRNGGKSWKQNFSAFLSVFVSMATESVRVRLLFENRNILSESQRSEGLKRSWILIKPEHEAISDLAALILHVFDLHDACPNGLVLSVSRHFRFNFHLKNNPIFSFCLSRLSCLVFVITFEHNGPEFLNACCWFNLSFSYFHWILWKFYFSPLLNFTVGMVLLPGWFLFTLFGTVYISLEWKWKCI